MSQAKPTKGAMQPGTPVQAKVQQQFADGADLGKRIARHQAANGRFGGFPRNPNATVQPRFLDISGATDFHAMLNRVTQIESMFARLPAKLRSRHRNSPELLLRWLEDPANAKQAVKEGLIIDPEIVQAVRDAEARDLEAEASKAGEPAPKADKEAQPSYTTPKGGTTPSGG